VPGFWLTQDSTFPGTPLASQRDPRGPKWGLGPGFSRDTRKEVRVEAIGRRAPCAPSGLSKCRRRTNLQGPGHGELVSRTIRGWTPSFRPSAWRAFSASKTLKTGPWWGPKRGFARGKRGFAQGKWGFAQGKWGLAQDTLQSEGGQRRLTCGREAGGRVPGGGRSFVGALYGFVRPGDSGSGPEGGPRNPLSSTPPSSRSGLGIYVSTSSASDPTRHGRERSWALMEDPIPHPMTAEGQREDLGIGRPAQGPWRRGRWG
jgi:hypothetical protein